MSLEGLNGCFHQAPFLFLLILGNYHNVLCTAKLVVSIRVLFFKFMGLRILMTKNTHNIMESDATFFKKFTFHFTELRSRKNDKNEDQLLTASSRPIKSLKNLNFSGLLLSKVYNVWAKNVQRSYLLWQWRVM